MNKLLRTFCLIFLAATAWLLGQELESAFAEIFPEHFPEPAYNLASNSLTQARVDLGRALFYDPLLSKDGTISCASCHSPYHAFAHTDHDLSHGLNDQIGRRNAPALFNLAWNSAFNLDGAVNHLDMQALAPINDPAEMGEATTAVVAKLQGSSLYSGLFMRAFEDAEITSARMLKALAAFQLTLVSANSKYDRIKRGEEQFTEQENKGYILFQQHCNSCHTEPLFRPLPGAAEFASNGLPVDTTLNDYGRGAVTLQARDSLLFKIPSLRNLTYTYPYMHDGRYRRIREVLEHYSSESKEPRNLAAELKSPIKLTSAERVELTAFLLTLDDKDFVFERSHQFPKEILLSSEGL